MTSSRSSCAILLYILRAHTLETKQESVQALGESYFVVSNKTQFREVMMKSFSRRNLDSTESITELVRAASKLSIDELAAAMDGTQEQAASIITVY